MCGRFTLAIQLELWKERFGVEPADFDLRPRYNVAPTQQISVIRNDGEQNNLAMMRWGLVPFWAKEIDTKFTMINARDDKILETRSYVGAFKARRCLIPATGFYEWKKGPGKSKQPMFIRLKPDEPFAFAGIWERWQNKSDPDAENLLSCSIITTRPNSLMEPIHDRMPMILPGELYEEWLDPTNEDLGLLKEMLLPYDPAQMEAYPVYTLVNSVRNNGPELIEPMDKSADD